MQAQGEAPARRHVISSRKEALHMTEKLRAVRARYDDCLLYTSDAADE